MINMNHVLGNPTLQCYDRLIKKKIHITLIWGTLVTGLESIEKQICILIRLWWTIDPN